MSSHHFVREDQEPALLILSAEAAPFPLVQELLEWSPTVIVAESIINEVLPWGIKIDVVVGLFENLDVLKLKLKDQLPVKFLSCNSTAEMTSTALYFLIASKQKAVNILSDVPLEVFETFSTLDVCVFQSGKKWSLIRSGNYEKWIPAGRTLLVYPGSESVTTATDGIVTIRKDNSFWVCEA